MIHERTLDHLLKIEAEAASLVIDAKKEAERRLAENEEKNRYDFDDRLKKETDMLEASFKKENNIMENRYRQELDDYCKDISFVNIDIKGFACFLNKYLAVSGEG